MQMHATIGELTSAFYEEALREFGDKEVASRVAAQLINEYLNPRSTPDPIN